MRLTATIFLFTVIFLQTFAAFVYDIFYALNKDYIAQTFCVNKNKPGMHCNGHCYLTSQKQKEEANDKQQTGESRHEKFEVTAYCLPESSAISFYPSFTKPCYSGDANYSLPGFSPSVFHPPSC